MTKRNKLFVYLGFFTFKSKKSLADLTYNILKFKTAGAIF